MSKTMSRDGTIVEEQAVFLWHCGLPRTSIYFPVLCPIRQCELIITYFSLGFGGERKYVFHIGKLKNQMT